jgi:GT2 family glycosyltransferase
MGTGMSCFSYRASVIIPNWNGIKWLQGCLDGLRNQSMSDFEIIVVDNGSGDGSVTYLRDQFPAVKIISFEKNAGFSVAVNAGISKARGEFIVLLNNDCVPEREWLAALCRVMENAPADVGSLASLMIRIDDPSVTDDAGDFLDWHGFAFKRGHGEPSSQWSGIEPVFSACAGAALYRRSFLEKTGGFDERFVSYFEDIDIGLRGNLFGYRCLFVPSARVRHKGHGSAMPSAIYAYHATKNRVMILLKNIPGPLLIRHAGTLLLGQAYSFWVYKHPVSSIRAYLYLLFHFPEIIRQRSDTLPGIVLSSEKIESMLHWLPAGRSA